MNIGIVFHSQTGHTFAFARSIASVLRTKNHTVELLPISTKHKTHPGMRDVKLDSIPNLTAFDGICFGSPTWAFAATPIFMTFMNTLSTLANKKCAIFATMGFPHPSLGGSRAISQINQRIISLEGTVIATEVVPLLFHNFNKCTKIGAQRIAEAFQ